MYSDDMKNNLGNAITDLEVKILSAPTFYTKQFVYSHLVFLPNTNMIINSITISRSLLTCNIINDHSESVIVQQLISRSLNLLI